MVAGAGVVPVDMMQPILSHRDPRRIKSGWAGSDPAPERDPAAAGE